jgi:hypothetical protein
MNDTSYRLIRACLVFLFLVILPFLIFAKSLVISIWKIVPRILFLSYLRITSGKTEDVISLLVQDYKKNSSKQSGLVNNHLWTSSDVTDCASYLEIVELPE